MKKKWLLLEILFLVLFVIVSVGFSAEGKKMARGTEAPAGFAERFAEVNGVRLHCLIDAATIF